MSKMILFSLINVLLHGLKTEKEEWGGEGMIGGKDIDVAHVRILQ